MKVIATVTYNCFTTRGDYESAMFQLTQFPIRGDILEEKNHDYILD